MGGGGEVGGIWRLRFTELPGGVVVREGFHVEQFFLGWCGY